MVPASVMHNTPSPIGPETITFPAFQAVPATRPPATRVSHGKPYVETLRLAAEDRADLIVIGVHGRNPVDLHLFGSTTNQLVRRATCPVLTVRR